MLRWVCVLEWEGWEVLPAAWAPPLEAFKHSGALEVCLAVPSPDPESLLRYAARQAFWDFSHEQLSKIAGVLGVSSGVVHDSELFVLLSASSRSILDPLPDEDLCEILALRQVRAKADPFEEVVLSSEEIYQAAPTDLQSEIADQAQNIKKQERARRAFAADFQKLARTTAEARAARLSASASASLAGAGAPAAGAGSSSASATPARAAGPDPAARAAALASAEADISTPELNSLLPPGFTGAPDARGRRWRVWSTFWGVRPLSAAWWSYTPRGAAKILVDWAWGVYGGLVPEDDAGADGAAAALAADAAEGDSSVCLGGAVAGSAAVALPAAKARAKAAAPKPHAGAASKGRGKGRGKAKHVKKNAYGIDSSDISSVSSDSGDSSTSSESS
jgi:hypothetical protein